MIAVHGAECTTCGATFDLARPDRTYGLRAWDPVAGEWTVDCPACGGLLQAYEDPLDTKEYDM